MRVMLHPVFGETMVKLRQVPEDFVVEEVGGPEPNIQDGWQDDQHHLYRLYKRGHDSLALLARLSRELEVPRRAWGLSGLKDRHAVTTQTVSVPSAHRICTEIGEVNSGDDWSLTLLGGCDQKVRSGVHEWNRFTLNIRDITYEQVQQLPERVVQLEKHGVPNWFDSQRFGSAIKGVLPGAHIIERDFEGAMNLYLAQRSPSDRSATRRDKAIIDGCWPNLEQIDAGELSHKPLRKPIRAYARAIRSEADNVDPFKAAYLAMPRDLRGMWLSAWQSRRWNQSLAKLFSERFDEHLLHPVGIPTGDILLFPHAPAGRSGVAKHSLVQNITERLSDMPDSLPMQTEDLSDIDGFLAEHDRPCIIHPSEFSISEPERDEMNGSGKRKRWKTTLSFSLPPGAYATVVIKRLFH